MLDSRKISAGGAVGLSRNRYVLVALAALALAALAALTFGLLGTMGTPPAQAQAQDVCDDLGDWFIDENGNWQLPVDGDPNGSVKMDVEDLEVLPTGDANVIINPDGSVTITAPDGWLIHDYCVKGGQEIEGFPDPIIVDPVKTITLGPLEREGQPDADVSHFSLSFIEDENGNGFEGCTPGYWKNHTGLTPPWVDSWAATAYSPGQTVGSVFNPGASSPYNDNTLLEALNFGGGPGVNGGKQILLRAAVAALLNAAHPDVNYPMTEAEVIAAVDAALASNDRNTMLALATQLDEQNNLGGSELCHDEEEEEA
jgi:hypothetical protein